MTYQVTNPMTGMLNKPVSPSMAVTNAVNKATSTPTDVTRLGTIAPQVQPTVNNAPAQTLANTVGTMSEQFQLAPAPTPTPTQAPAPAPAPAPQEQSILQKTLDSIMGVSTQLESKGQRSLEIQQEEGVFDYKEQVENYKNEFIAKERAFDKQIEEAKKNNEGKLRGGVQIDIQGLESRKFSQLADIAFLHEISSGKYERAWQIAQAKIDAEFAPLVARLDTLKSYYQLAQNDMTESEKLQAQTKIREQESAIDFQRTKELKAYEQTIRQSDPLYQAQLAKAKQEALGGSVGFMGEDSMSFSDLSPQQIASLSGVTRTVMQNPQGFKNLTPTIQGQVLEELGRAGVDASPLFPDPSRENAARAAYTVVRDGQLATELMDKSTLFFKNGVSNQSTLSASRRAIASMIPGTDTFEINKAIQSVKDNIGIDALLNIKREGSGLGQVPQKQLESLQGLLGRLDITRDPAILRRDIADALKMYQSVMNVSGDEIMRVMSNPVTRLETDFSLDTPSSQANQPQVMDLNGVQYKIGNDGLYYPVNK